MGRERGGCSFLARLKHLTTHPFRGGALCLLLLEMPPTFGRINEGRRREGGGGGATSER